MNRTKNLFAKSAVVAAIALSVLPFAVSAAGTTLTGTAADKGVGSSDPKDSGFQLVSCTGVVDPRTNKGVECNYEQLIATASRVIQYTFFILAPIVTLMVLVVGWQYLTAGSDTVKLEKAKKMIKPLLLGLLLMSSAYVIVYKFILEKLLAENIGELTKSDIINSSGR